MCFAGSIRDIILMKNFDLISIIAALFAVMAVYNAATGSFHLGFSGQPIAHSQHLWNILGMYVVGFAAVLAGGCVSLFWPARARLTVRLPSSAC
mgnify:CR=1 FL=1